MLSPTAIVILSVAALFAIFAIAKIVVLGKALQREKDARTSIETRHELELLKQKEAFRDRIEQLEETEKRNRELEIDLADTRTRAKSIEEENNRLRNNTFWTEEYSKALGTLLSPVEKVPILFIHGAAGTGKSRLMDFCETAWRASHPGTYIAKTAPTGIAAANIGGMTIHSLFQFPVETFPPESRLAEWMKKQLRQLDHKEFATRERVIDRLRKIASDPDNPDQAKARRCEFFASLSLLMIDEISMTKPAFIDAIDRALRLMKRDPRPFGGCKVALFGDLGQLPPVCEKKDELVECPYNIATYQDPKPYFFKAHALKHLSPTNGTIQLSHVFRQDDEAFIHALHDLRRGTPIKKAFDGIALDVVDMQNKKDPRTNPPISERMKRTTLFGKNKPADQANSICLQALKTSPVHSFNIDFRGEFWAEKEEEEINKLIKYERCLKLKEGARVMILKNTAEYCNGTIGEVVNIDQKNEIVRVKVAPRGCAEIKYFDIGRDTIKIRDPSLATTEEERCEGGKEVGSYSQIPLKLAWAITIHKSQGQTFEEVYADLSTTWAFGQCYVALSRARRLHGLHVIVGQDTKIPACPTELKPWLES